MGRILFAIGTDLFFSSYGLVLLGICVSRLCYRNISSYDFYKLSMGAFIIEMSRFFCGLCTRGRSRCLGLKIGLCFLAVISKRRATFGKHFFTPKSSIVI
jgi:hypothetical protein